MKRFLALMAAMAMALSLTACGTTQNNGSSASGSGSITDNTQQNPATNDNMGDSTTDQGSSTTGSVRTGVGVVISMDGTQGATDTTAATARSEITVCAASFDENGKILGVMFDAAEPGVEFDSAGALITDLANGFETKRQPNNNDTDTGEDWYSQVIVLENWMVGKTADEVLNMSTTTENDLEYADEEDLASTMTIPVGAFLEALQMAYDNAESGAANGTETSPNSQSEQSSTSESAQ